MECNIIKDLIPLYIDNCCSSESEKLVADHIQGCCNCKKLVESMRSNTAIVNEITMPVLKLDSIRYWKASVLQSLALLISFAVIILGVFLESRTPIGVDNGLWVVRIVVPATGFMISLVNWYFVRAYANRKRFSWCSSFVFVAVTFCGYIWSCFHYGFFKTNNIFIEKTMFVYLAFFVGVFITAAFFILSKVLSNEYAKMIGKE